MRSMGNGITNCYPDQVDSFISITVLNVTMPSGQVTLADSSLRIGLRI